MIAPHAHPSHPRGIAIVWVLLLGAFLALISITFLAVATQARRATDHEADRQTADEMLAAARAEIIAKLHDGFADVAETPRRASVTAMPGLIEVKRYDAPLHRGDDRSADAFDQRENNPPFFASPFAREYDGQPANPRWIPLFSHRSFAPALRHLNNKANSSTPSNKDYEPHAVFNINTADNPFTPGITWITGAAVSSTLIPRGGPADEPLPAGTHAALRPIHVQWIPILRDPDKPPSRANPMIARYAYWVDLENTKALVDDLRDFRETDAAPFLLGEPGHHDGGSARFDQDGGNSSRELLTRLESDLPGKPDANDLPVTRSGAPGPGLAAPALATARDTWLSPGGPAASCRFVDFSQLEATRTNDASENLTAAPGLLEAAGNASGENLHPFHLDLARFFDEPAPRQLARQISTALTTYGHEENLDPLGRPRIDLRAFQQSAGSHAAIVSSPLFARLTDRNYASVYQPGTAGASLADALAPFSANGDSALAQLLLNIAEASKPDSSPPLIDERNGLVGARSMPYVAEISTRARSAYWLLPEADRENPETLLQSTAQGVFSYTYKQKRLHHYATHAVVDLCVGLINPNPYETTPFEGEIEFDIVWNNKPATAETEPGPYRARISGHFTANPQPGKDANKLEPLGHTVNIRLGVFPVAALHDPKFATTFRLRGWKIRRADGSLWHQVPVRAPGASGSLDFWRMAQPGISAGSPSDEASLAAYQTNGHRSVGWFCQQTLDALLPNSLDVLDWENANTTRAQDPDLERRVTEWIDRAAKTSVLERLVCLDPTLGHRTGNPAKKGIFGNGDFYGMKGHPWRRSPVIRMQSFVQIDQTIPHVQAIDHADWLVALNGAETASARIRRPSGDRLVSSSSSFTVPRAAFQLARRLNGEVLTHRLIRPGQTDEDLSKSLTTAYLLASLEGPAFPHHFDPPKPPTSFPIDAQTVISQVDVETTRNSPQEKPAKDYVKLPDGKRGPRGFFCSAPPKRPFTSVGEIGFVHSGFTLTPILIGPDQGALPTQLNAPQNGPPMRMLLDLLTVPADGRPWNVNTTIAHDQYMALREGGGDLTDMKQGVDPSSAAARAVWLPAAQGFMQRADGSDSFRGKEAKHLAEKNPGQLLDTALSPYPQLRRPWDIWTGVIGGDYSRSGESRRWCVGNAAFSYFRPGYFTWRPGDGAGDDPWLDFGSDLPGMGRVLAFGIDGRKDDKNEGKGTLKGRHAADQNLEAIDGSLDFRLPPTLATRFSLLPVRHFPSDLALDFHQENHESEWSRIKTALNPSIGAAHSPGEAAKDIAKAAEIEGTAPPGGHHASGVFYHAPMALLTNQAGFSANAFTAYIVVETIRDRGRKNPDIERSGPGWCDADDVVLARHWSRQIILRETGSDGRPAFRTVSHQTIAR
jgi:hypothetical protein